jgi:hypothetical protein
MHRERLQSTQIWQGLGPHLNIHRLLVGLELAPCKQKKISNGSDRKWVMGNPPGKIGHRGIEPDDGEPGAGHTKRPSGRREAVEAITAPARRCPAPSPPRRAAPRRAGRLPCSMPAIDKSISGSPVISPSRPPSALHARLRAASHAYARLPLPHATKAEGGAGTADLRGGRGHSGEEGRRWWRGAAAAGSG